MGPFVMNARPLADCRILVLEDNYFQAEDTRALLTQAGAIVVVVNRVSTAHAALGDTACDLALLDVNIEGTWSTGLARVCRERGVPVAFLTAYDSHMLPRDLAECCVMAKPLCGRAIVETLTKLWLISRDAGNGTASNELVV